MYYLFSAAVAVVGLDNIVYHDSEGVGVVEVCVVVYSPDIDCPIEFPFNLSLSTSSGICNFKPLPVQQLIFFG